MKNYALLFLPLAAWCAGCSSELPNGSDAAPEELQVALYDRDKEAVVYIDFGDDATLYAYDGEPVAFIHAEEAVFRFNGTFVGWYSDGVLYDKTGYAAGAGHGIVRGAINTVSTFPERVKGVKGVKPVKPFVEDAFARPVCFDTWSEQTLSELLGVAEQ